MQIDKRLGRAVLTFGAVSLSFGFAGCIDDKYDLSDIDSTVRVNVNDLVLPVNMKPVELHNVIDADSGEDPDGSEFRYDEQTGDYFILTTGDFNSDPIEIADIYVSDRPSETKSITTPVIEGISIDLASAPGVDMNDFNYEFNYTFDDVDDYIEDIDVITVENMSITLTVASSSSDVTLKNMEFKLTPGLIGTYRSDKGTAYYKEDTGELIISGEYQSATVTFNINHINIHDAGGSFDPATRTFVFANTLGLINGTVTSATTKPAEIISATYDLSALKVTAVTGKISYSVDVDDSNISLSDLPKELRQQGTDIALVNPQIYLTVTNPFSKYGVYASTGIELFQSRKGVTGSSPVASLNEFLIGGNADEQFSQQSICLSPEEPTKPYMPYSTYTEFAGLGNVVAGDGLPDELMIKFVRACIPDDTPVNEFPIGNSHGQMDVKGSYTFYAPLALKGNSTISYSGEDKDWDFEDSDDLHIDLLQISADVTSNIPLDVELTAVPLDAEGNEITNVKVEPARIAASSTSSVVISIVATDGTTITGIDGVKYNATVIADDSETVLNRNMSLSLDNLRAKVNGYYQTKL